MLGWAFLPSMGSGSLWVMIRGAFGSGDVGAQSASELTLFLGSVSMALVQGIAGLARQDST